MRHVTHRNQVLSRAMVIHGKTQRPVQFELMKPDEESRIIPVSGSGFDQTCNTQAAVDTRSLLIVAPAVTQAANNQEQVVPMLEQLTALPDSPGQVAALLAGTGFTARRMSRLAKRRGLPRSSRSRVMNSIRPRKRALPSQPPCNRCNAGAGHRHKLKTKVGRALYGQRKQTVEPVFGITKSALGFRQPSLRGLNKVT